MVRRGMGYGTGKGYKNIAGSAPKIHSQSAKGIKQPQKTPIIPRYKASFENDKVIPVTSVPEDYQFIYIDYEVQAIKEYLGKDADDFDSFFVKTKDGDYEGIYGMEGTVPYNNKMVEKLR